MAEEMAIFKQTVKEDIADESAAPVVYTRLQMLLAYIDDLEKTPVDGSDKVLYRISTRGVGDFFVVARSLDEATDTLRGRLEDAEYGFYGDRKPTCIDIIAEERLDHSNGKQYISEDYDNLIVAKEN